MAEPKVPVMVMTTKLMVNPSITDLENKDSHDLVKDINNSMEDNY